MAHRPSCSAACGILPDQGPNPCPLHWQADSQPLHYQGSPGDHTLRTTAPNTILGVLHKSYKFHSISLPLKTETQRESEVMRLIMAELEFDFKFDYSKAEAFPTGSLFSNFI